jgi:hypothetical protein
MPPLGRSWGRGDEDSDDMAQSVYPIRAAPVKTFATRTCAVNRQRPEIASLLTATHFLPYTSEQQYAQGVSFNGRT